MQLDVFLLWLLAHALGIAACAVISMLLLTTVGTAVCMFLVPELWDVDEE